MLSEVPTIVVDAGVAAGAIVAVLGLMAALTRLRPVRWIWRQLVADPVAEWFRREVGEEIEASLGPVRAELQANGGSTVKDKVDALAADVASIKEQVAEFAPVLDDWRRSHPEIRQQEDPAA